MNEIMDVKGLKSLTKQNSASGSKDNFKQINDIVLNVKTCIDGVMGIVSQYKTAQAMTNPQEDKGGDAGAKYEKGLERGKKEGQAQQKQVQVIIHADKASSYIKSKMDEFIVDGMTGKELKHQIKSMDDKTFQAMIESFITQHISIQ